jgi:tetratricopeptide (TPR) repeat protein
VQRLAISNPQEGSSGRVTGWMTKRHSNKPWFVLLLLAQLVAGAAAQDKGPDCAKARSYLSSAQAAINAKDSVTAVQELNQAVRIAPRCADAYLLLGLNEFRNGATSDSIQHYQKALLLQPWSYSGHYDLALAYLKEQKLPEARAQLEEAVKLDPGILGLVRKQGSRSVSSIASVSLLGKIGVTSSTWSNGKRSWASRRIAGICRVPLAG